MDSGISFTLPNYKNLTRQNWPGSFFFPPLCFCVQSSAPDDICQVRNKQVSNLHAQGRELQCTQTQKHKPEEKHFLSNTTAAPPSCMRFFLVTTSYIELGTSEINKQLHLLQLQLMGSSAILDATHPILLSGGAHPYYQTTCVKAQ